MALEDEEIGPASPNYDVETVFENIGFGFHQMMMFFLCGMGWFADNMWLEAVGVILPRVQQSFLIADGHIGIITSCYYAGTAIGAPLWGIISDRYGRRIPFFVCPVVSAVAAGIAAASPSFAFLCAFICLLGFGESGFVPIDGTILAEYLPTSKHYFITLLAMFYGIGDATASGLAWAILPGTSCDQANMSTDASGMPIGYCPSSQNNGWRIYLGVLAGLQVVFLISRIIGYRERDTPGFLLGKGRKEEAMEVLRHVARRNGRPTEGMGIEDVQCIDGLVQADMREASQSYASILRHRKASDSHPATSPSHHVLSEKAILPPTRFKTLAILFHGRIATITTLLVWFKWFLMGFGYVMYTSFLPKVLEDLNSKDDGLSSGYRDLFIYAISASPGSVIARWCINTRLGRKGTMALFMWLNAGMLFVFTAVNSHVAAVVSISLVNLVGGVVWAALGTYAPEVFSVEARGTGTGVASMMQRIASICAPLVAGTLITINSNLPLWVASGSIGLAGVLAILLPIETRPRRTHPASS